MQYKVSFHGRAHQYTEQELALINDVARDAVPLTQGKYKNSFEEKFKAQFSAEHAFAVSTATAGLELAAQMCQFSEGDEVIIPGHTFTSSAYPFVKKGANIVWADIDLDTLVTTAELLEEKITEKTKAIVVVHLYGYMVDMESVMALAKKHNLLVIEDVAQAAGTQINGKYAGTFGDFGIFSFHSHKNITTLGEGGMITCKDEKFAKVIPLIRHNGHCGFEFKREHYWLPAMGNVDLPMLNGQPVQPNNYCLGEIECALGEKLLDRLAEMNAQKRERAIAFIDALKDFNCLHFNREASVRHNYHLLVFRVSGIDRDELIQLLSSQYKIQAIVQYYPLYRYDYYKKMGFGIASCPNTDLFFDNMVSLPFNHMLADADVEYMLASLKESVSMLLAKQENTEVTL